MRRPLEGITPDVLLVFAIKFAHESLWRRCAKCYLLAYTTCDPGWEYKYNCWSGFTSVLMEQRFDDDEYTRQLTRVARDPTARALDRAVARSAKGQLAYNRGDREAAARSYRRVLEVAEAATVDERQSTVLFSSAAGMRPTPVRRLLDAEADMARFNLDQMASAGTVCGPDQIREVLSQHVRGPYTRNLRYGVLTGPNCADPVANNAEVSKRMLVAGSSCDVCAAPRSATIRLKPCSRCKLVYYCGKSCQQAAWRLGHKDACRAPGDYRVGDYVQVHGLSSAQIHGLRDGAYLGDDRIGLLHRCVVEVANTPTTSGVPVAIIGAEPGFVVTIRPEYVKRIRPKS